MTVYSKLSDREIKELFMEMVVKDVGPEIIQELIKRKIIKYHEQLFLFFDRKQLPKRLHNRYNKWLIRSVLEQ